MKGRRWAAIVRDAVVCVSLVVLPGASVATSAESPEKVTKPYTHYWMSVATQNQSIPGMSGMSGMGAMMGSIMGMPGGGSGRTLYLQLDSPKALPADPSATHDIPPVQNMGKTLPLLIPVHERAVREEPEEREEPVMEKPKVRMLIYWGCGEKVREGQPRVLDTDKMSPMEFGKAMRSRGSSRQYPPSPRKGWVYADWPNKQSSIPVPKDSSLIGDHFVHGNYTPDIKFSLDARRDFMAPVEFTSVKGGLADSIMLQWKDIPTAIGYFAMAMGHNEKTGESIFWSSSEVADMGFGLMDYLPNADVYKFIKEKVVMDHDTLQCAIPEGIFKDTEGATLQFIGYGEELNLVHPPKPKDPKEPWNIIWAAKVRLKSTGMLVLGMEGQDDRGTAARRGRRGAEQPQPSEVEQPQQTEKPAEDEGVKGTIKKFKGLLGF
ncbi:MAG: hypothetical protein ACM3ON_12270 [Chloroflexota bacterium]